MVLLNRDGILCRLSALIFNQQKQLDIHIFIVLASYYLDGNKETKDCQRKHFS